MLRRLSNAASIVFIAFLIGSCGAPKRPQAAIQKITVAAAANLRDVFGDVGTAFQAKTGVAVGLSYGSTAGLSQQIENGAPFDIFASADVEHIDSLIAAQKLTAGSRAIYALGQLALWIPNGEQSGIRQLQDLVKPAIRFISIAQPDLAPYGRATVEALKNAHLWDTVQRKVVYANSISQARQLAVSKNADAAFTAYSLALNDPGIVIKVDPALYQPIRQALGIVKASPLLDEAEQFRTFLLGPEGRKILADRGYLLP